MLPTNVLQSLDVHVELALKEGTRCRDEPALLDLIPAGHGELIPSFPPAFPPPAIRGLTTFPRVMWKEPDSVFSNMEEVNSVFRALGVKSARMSILERMRWVAEEQHVDFQQYPVTTPEGPRPALCLFSCPPSALSGSQSEAPESAVTSKAVRSSSTMLEESSWSTPISEMGKYLCSFCRETGAP